MTRPESSEPLFGTHTALAVQNFEISGESVPWVLVDALLAIKAAAAEVNARRPGDTGVDVETSDAIISAVAEVRAGGFESHFPVDVFQTGSGTSTNMNVNEVVATLASRRLGREIHPNDHVNASQSSNDTFPAAIRVAALGGVVEGLLPSLDRLRGELRRAAVRFESVVKAGRTHHMDATPVMLGQEFGGYSTQIRQAMDRLGDGLDRLGALPIGGTATGNGLNAPIGFGREVAGLLAAETGLPITETDEHFSAQGSQDALVELSGHLRGTAVALFKIAGDIRLMASGPRTGLAEITLPSLQPGSSIMPGKVNPVMCEVVTQVAVQVIGNDSAVAFAGSQGTLELNVFLPVIARNVLDTIALLSSAADSFATRCVAGIEANADVCRSYAESTPAIATALNSHLGYDEVADIVADSAATGRTIREVVLDRALLSAEVLDAALDVDSMARGTNPPA